MTIVRVQMRVPNYPGVQEFTAEAVASMVGQKPRWLLGLDWSRGGPRATVLDASLDGGNMLVTLDVDERAVPEGLTDPFDGGIGFTAKSLTYHGRVDDVDVVAVGPVVGPPVRQATP